MITRIYGLFTGDLCWYVGSTLQTLKDRTTDHRSKSNGTNSRYIPKEFQWEMKLLEECEQEVRYARERHWYESLMPLYNKTVPARSKQEYSRSEVGRAVARAARAAYRARQREIKLSEQ